MLRGALRERNEFAINNLSQVWRLKNEAKILCNYQSIIIFQENLVKTTFNSFPLGRSLSEANQSIARSFASGKDRNIQARKKKESEELGIIN